MGSSLELLQLGVGLPGRCTRAFLRGCYSLDPKRVEKANGVATTMAVVATIVGAVVILFAMVWVALQTG